VLIISLGSFQHWKICLSSLSIGSGGTKISLKYSVNMLLTCTLYYDARPIRTVCNYRKCSLLTGLVTSLTDLFQANHQGRIGTTKTKSTGSPALAPIASLSEFFCFALAEIFFRPRREPVCRLSTCYVNG